PSSDPAAAESRSRCVPPFDAGQDRAELFETPEIMAREEAVDEGECGAHPARERLVLGIALQRVDPDDCKCGARELRHLAPDEVGIVALPTVGDDDDDR